MLKRKKILWAVLEGCTNRAWQIQTNQPISGKIAKMAHFNPCMKFENCLGQIILFKVPLALSKCLSKWIKVDKWDYFQNLLQDFFLSFLFYILVKFFFEYETIVRSSTWSFGLSDPDPSSVHTKLYWKVGKVILEIVAGPERFLDR